MKAYELEPFLAPAVQLGFATGMRRGETLALEWDDIDFARKRIHVRRAFVAGHVEPPKSGKDRTVSLADSLATALKAHRKAQKLAAPWASSDLVVPAPKGGHRNQHNFSRAWRRLRTRCAPDVRPFVFHCTRHAFATLALDAGRNIKWVADVLGHSDPTITLRTYAHALPCGDDAMDFLPAHANRMQPHAKQKVRKVAKS